MTPREQLPIISFFQTIWQLMLSSIDLAKPFFLWVWTLDNPLTFLLISLLFLYSANSFRVYNAEEVSRIYALGDLYFYACAHTPFTSFGPVQNSTSFSGLISKSYEKACDNAYTKLQSFGYTEYVVGRKVPIYNFSKVSSYG